MLKLFAAFFALSSVAAFAAGPQSDTIPTAQLVVYYSVQAGTGATANAGVQMTQVFVKDGQLQEVSLTQSKDDVVTFSTDSATMTFDPANPSADVIAFSAGATYSINFKRFNGETYTSSFVMPGLANVTQPAAGATFKKTDAVTINWTAPKGAQPALFAVGTNCSAVQGDVMFSSDYTSAAIPANYATPCTGDVQVEFDAYYANLGTGFGSSAGVSVTSVRFSYGNATLPATTITPMHPDLSHSALKAVRAQKKPRIVQYTF